MHKKRSWKLTSVDEKFLKIMKNEIQKIEKVEKVSVKLRIMWDSKNMENQTLVSRYYYYLNIWKTGWCVGRRQRARKWQKGKVGEKIHRDGKYVRGIKIGRPLSEKWRTEYWKETGKIEWWKILVTFQYVVYNHT